MIGNKLRSDDVILEVEDKHAYNIAPEVLPAQVYVGTITGVPVTSNSSYSYDDRTKTVYPTWTWSFNSANNADTYKINKNMDAEMFKVGDLNVSGVAGQSYFTTILFKQRAPSMVGSPSYVGGPVARAVLYASNGTPSQDVVIAQSGDIRGPNFDSSWAQDYYYSRNVAVQLYPTQPMPAGKPYFKFGIRYDNAYTSNNAQVNLLDTDFDQSLPSPLPTALGLWQVLSAPTVYYTNSAGSQWKSVNGTTTYPVEGKVTSSTSGIRSTFNIPADSKVSTLGARFTANTYTTAAVTLSITGGSTSYSESRTGTAWKAWNNIPASALSGANVTVTVGTTNLSDPQLFANINDTDTDGYNYWTYTNEINAVSEISINQFDSEVSTAVITLRDDTGKDTSDLFIPGKRVRVRTNTLPNEFEGTIYNRSVNPKSAVFTGTVVNKRVTYPYGARPEIKVLVSNDWPNLLEKNQYCFSVLDSYKYVLPYEGVCAVVGTNYYGPKLYNPSISYDGLWRFIDEGGNTTVLDTMMITRNNQFGFFWFDRHNQLQVQNAQPSGSTVFTDAVPAAGEFSFSGLDVAYDTSSIINSIKIEAFDNVTTIDENGNSNKDVVQYNYTMQDPESIKKWRKSEYKLQMFEANDYDNVLNQVLSKYRTPVIGATGLKFPVRTTTELAQVSQIDIYEMIHVKYQDKIDAKFRIHTIKHTIKPGETWSTELGFGLNTESPLW